MFLLIALPGVADSGAEGQAVEDLVRAIRQKYETVDSLTADFAQKNYIATLDQFRHFQGHVSLKRPHLFSMNVTSPSAQRLVFDGQFYWVYTEATEQVIKNAVPPNFTQHPLINVIHTMENLDKDFIVSQGITRSADEHSLALTLKKPESDITGVHLTVGKEDLKIHELLLRYCSGDYTQFTVSDIKENSPIAEDVFRFEPPPGVEVVENSTPAVPNP